MAMDEGKLNNLPEDAYSILRSLEYYNKTGVWPDAAYRFNDEVLDVNKHEENLNSLPKDAQEVLKSLENYNLGVMPKEPQSENTPSSRAEATPKTDKVMKQTDVTHKASQDKGAVATPKTDIQDGSKQFPHSRQEEQKLPDLRALEKTKEYDDYTGTQDRNLTVYTPAEHAAQRSIPEEHEGEVLETGPYQRASESINLDWLQKPPIVLPPKYDTLDVLTPEMVNGSRPLTRYEEALASGRTPTESEGSTYLQHLEEIENYAEQKMANSTIQLNDPWYIPPSTGIIYERVNPITHRVYIGQALSLEHFRLRMQAHDNEHGVRHYYRILARIQPKYLSQTEEGFMRLMSGPMRYGGLTENKRWQISDRRYRGNVLRPPLRPPFRPPIRINLRTK